MKLLRSALALLPLFVGAPNCYASIDIRPAPSAIVQYGDSSSAAFLVINKAKAAVSSDIAISCHNGAVTPTRAHVNLKPGAWQIVPVTASLADSADQGLIRCASGSVSATVSVTRGLDLSDLTWRRKVTPLKQPLDPSLASPDTDDSTWAALTVPTIIQDVAYSWCRVHFTAPERWRGKALRLEIGAVDDNDVTFLNGVQIGRTDGWDTPRKYAIAQNIIRWGADNVLCVRVENNNFGGGIYKLPIMLMVGNAQPPLQTSATNAPIKRAAPGRIGSALPLRRIHADQGILRYPDGAEVALWGVNYYPQSWYQFDNMMKLKVDMKATIRADLNDMQRMGVQAIRIHCFDREISDGDGNIVDNLHLELLDYLVSECSRRSIYMYFTPIAWWGGPNERHGAFSGETTKPGMSFVPKARTAAANYLRHFLTRKNRFTGRAYMNEPCLVLLEVQNEPAYFTYSDIIGKGYETQGERADVLERDYITFRQQWRDWLSARKLADSPAFFPLFRYEMMRGYIHKMVSAIKSTGAKQPVAISYFGVNGDDLTQAIADSECDAITVSTYPGGWGQMNDKINLLYQVAPLKLDNRLAAKARLAYEFDTPATNTSCYLYPGIAAYFRAAEVQVACQFQYDSISTARWNTDWGAHWLNWRYTPTKAVSYMVGGEAFRSIPRGATYATPKTELHVGSMAVSFPHNQSLFMTPQLAMYARSTDDWRPVAMPKAPQRIVGTGSSPWVKYDGNGAYVLAMLNAKTIRLTLNADVTIVGDCLTGSLDKPVAEIVPSRHPFKLTLAGWDKAKCYRVGSNLPLPSTVSGWMLEPGEYEIRR